MKTTPIPVKFDRQGHSCNFYGGFGPTFQTAGCVRSCVGELPLVSSRCRLYLHRITSTVISELTRGQIRPKLDHDDVVLLLALGIAKASLLAE